MLRRYVPYGTRRALTTTTRLASKASSSQHAHEVHEHSDYGVRAPFWERALLGTGSALGLLVSPRRGDLLVDPAAGIVPGSCHRRVISRVEDR